MKNLFIIFVMFLGIYLINPKVTFNSTHTKTLGFGSSNTTELRTKLVKKSLELSKLRSKEVREKIMAYDLEGKNPKIIESKILLSNSHYTSSSDVYNAYLNSVYVRHNSWLRVIKINK
jgi:hypothetical protein